MNGKKLSEKEFISRCKKVNPQFKYDNIGFTKLHGGFVYPICKKHGQFKFNAVGLSTKHIKCPECDREERFYTFVDKAKAIHRDKYQYIMESYKTNKIPMTIVCPKHGTFKQAPGDHLKGWGCSKCSGKYKPTTEEWILKAAPVYNNRYDYSKVIYIDNKTPVTVICPEHGEFLQTPNAHLSGAGCPKCKNKNQTILFEKLSNSFKELNFNYEFGIKWLEGQRFDIYNSQFNFAVEYDGLQHYKLVEHFGGESYFKIIQERDVLKNEKCIHNNCKLFRVKYNYTESDYQELILNIKNYISNKNNFIPILKEGSAISII